jgi:hypothetical protein
MSVVRQVQLVCDICNYPSRWFTDSATSAAKQELRLQGWRFRSGVHRCPTCVTNANLAPQHPTDEATDEGAGEE